MFNIVLLRRKILIMLVISVIIYIKFIVLVFDFFELLFELFFFLVIFESYFYLKNYDYRNRICLISFLLVDYGKVDLKVYFRYVWI